jgi:phosphatidylserine decarboxylase
MGVSLSVPDEAFKVSLATFAAAQILRVLPKEHITHVVGRLCEQPLPSFVSAVVSRVYSRAFRVDMTEAAAAHGSYRSFDAFFTRPLRAGTRTIADSWIVSPSDGRLSAEGPIDEASRVFVKGQPYEVSELLGNSVDAQAFTGGSFSVIYLSPRDYHRVHCPVDGHVANVRAIEGELYPVNAIGERHIPKLFVRNRRVVIDIESNELGRVALVMVGALVVGKISVNVLGSSDVEEGDHPIVPPMPVRRGDELGAFHLGSTCVLLVQNGSVLRCSEGNVAMGQSLSLPRTTSLGQTGTLL